ncbi:uncharacterized protein J8A68_002376 [[Candida] subhashii]|uniref:GH16 domain-containing protein n=1 Tax=[Candida] subhashii TaxID=561895 RepID=A0A8J5QJB6_9ASCO|nr:uncharacterized protein J8A68_002376 [[Candida] subhashii]KAG7664122.1 hypothetical protein J8A68_002376 [[Candida] subhashii]
MPDRDLTSNSWEGETDYNISFSSIDEQISFVFNADNSPSTTTTSSGSFGRAFTATNTNYATSLPLLPVEGSGSTSTTNSATSSGDGSTAIISNATVQRVKDMNVSSATDYDRYPSINGFKTSRAPPLDRNALGSSNSSNSTMSKSIDFNPFGGYPASSFPLHIDEKEPDDDVHNPDPVKDIIYDKNRFWYDLKRADKRALSGLFSFLFLIIAAGAVFIALPILTFTPTHKYIPWYPTYPILTHYEYPMLSAIRTSLVDPDTPQEAMNITARDGTNWVLVFSDEFNAIGRTFYEGDDQFWTAPDFQYHVTNDLEWYDPDAVTTINSSISLRMDAFQNHDLFYRSGMLQSWNKFCFTQGKIIMSAQLPYYGNVSGLWPGMWTMGNLGRPGYSATTDGVWPYSYNSCDAGITANQSSSDGISYLPGQRLNSCTCPGESHPNPGVGRGAPEIDLIEAATGWSPSGETGVASQSVQLAPFDIWYMPDYSFIEIYNASVTTMNTYAGGPFQQALSATTMLNLTWYERGANGTSNFQEYAFEYINDDTIGYIRWFVGDQPTMTVHAQALHPNGNIDFRQISKEPMSIVMNLGMSNNWAYIDWPSLSFPVTMYVDYVRVYQPEDQINVGCDPPGYPTQEYIQQHLNIYSNINLTLFEEGGYTFPKNSLLGC